MSGLLLHRLEPCQGSRDVEQHCGFAYTKNVSSNTQVRRKYDLLCNDSAEPGPLYINSTFRPFADLFYLGPNVFALSIAVSPYHEHVGTLSFVEDISLDALGSLGNGNLYRGLEQVERIA